MKGVGKMENMKEKEQCIIEIMQDMKDSGKMVKKMEKE